jgi:multidrug resistance efflux pump
VGHSVGNHNLVSISTVVAEVALEFRVIWEIEIEADSPKQAAQEARVIQLTPGMSATVFDVWHTGRGGCTGLI